MKEQFFAALCIITLFTGCITDDIDKKPLKLIKPESCTQGKNMARQIYVPQAQAADQKLTNILSIAGAAGGALAGGGLPGAMGGMSAGGAIGGLMTPKPPAAPDAVGGAMERRMDQIQNSDLSKLRQSIDSLQYVKDDSLKESLAKPLLQAEFMARKKMAGGV